MKPLIWYKTQVDLAQIMRLYGFNLTKKSTALHQRLKRVKENGDKDLLIVKRNSQRHYTYWSPYEDELKGSTIVDFIGNEHGLRNIDQICKIVDDIIAGDNQVQAPRLELNKPSINVQDIIKHTKPLSNQTYLIERGFAKKTAEHKIFKSVIRNFKFPNSPIENVAGVIYNKEGVCGLNVRNHDYSRNYGSRGSGVFLSGNSKSSDELDQFILVESFEDALAHFEINESDLSSLNIRYGSSLGSLSVDQIRLLDSIFRKQSPKKICLGFDNDVAGLLYGLKFLSLTTFGVNDEFKFNDHCIEIHKSRGDVMVKITPDISLSGFDVFQNKFNQLLIEINDLAKPITGKSKTIFQPQRKLGEGKSILLSTNLNTINIKYCMGLIQRLKFTDPSTYHLELSMTKDFNEDLQARKGLHKTWRIVDLQEGACLEKR